MARFILMDRAMQNLERDQLAGRVSAFVLEARSEIAWMQFQISARRLLLALKAGFNANQPRCPAGSHEGGRWRGTGANPRSAHSNRVAASGLSWMGTLTREVFLGGIRYCVYNFGSRNYIVQGPAAKNFGCAAELYQSAVISHGTLINYNRW